MDTQKTCDQILMKALELSPATRWDQVLLDRAVRECALEPMAGLAAFPNGVADLAVYFSTWIDREMLARLQSEEVEHLRIRDKIGHAVQTRLTIMEPHKQAVSQITHWWMRPARSFQAGQAVWKSADVIWSWTGDTATDYNRYTKRGLLSGVLAATIIYWLRDNSTNHQSTKQFLENRLDQVVVIGKGAGRVVSAVKSGLACVPFFPFKKTAS